MRIYFNVELLNVVLIRLDLENVTYFSIFELDKILFVIRAKFNHINRLKFFFQNAFEMIDVNY
jgi:hypothetical protein